MNFIKAQNLVVEFPLFNNTHRSIKNTVINATTGGRLAKYANKVTAVRALDVLNFEINEGERLGIIGHNGSGKTTLLRTLAGAYEPTNGALHIRGRTASLLDISLGMDQDATGYENIFLRGIMMGLKKSEIREKIKEIAQFTELGDYLQMPVRTYSTGMQLRLAFAVSTCVKAEIIIMDEWLSVGDASFVSKASERLKELVDSASILVVASHDFEMLKRLCTRIIKLSHGKIVDEFTTQNSIKEYLSK